MILKSEVTINASVAVVFAAVTDPIFWVGMHPQTVAVYLPPKTSTGDLEPYPQGRVLSVGDIFYEDTKAGPVKSRWQWMCTDMAGNHSFAFQGQSKRLRCKITYLMRRVLLDGASAFIFERIMDIEGTHWLTRLTLPLFSDSIQRAGDEYLRRVKEKFEEVK